jgi:hypothetical protein
VAQLRAVQLLKLPSPAPAPSILLPVLPSKLKALSSSPSTATKKEEKKKQIGNLLSVYQKGTCQINDMLMSPYLKGCCRVFDSLEKYSQYAFVNQQEQTVWDIPTRAKKRLP